MKKTIWALLDDRIGSVGQAKGILQAVADDFDVVEKKIVYNKFAALPNCLRGKTLIGLDKEQSESLNEPWPDIVLSISRRTTPIALWIKKKSKGKTKIVQLMFPGKSHLQDLDLVIVSEHDRAKADAGNLFFITGCPHRVSEKMLIESKEKWNPVFAGLPKPWTSVIVGGAIKDKPFTLKNAEMLAETLLDLHTIISGSLFITTSRRTGAEAQEAIMKKLAHIPAYTYLWGEKKENPIMGFYACADKIVVTGDSVSMACESCGTGKPVLVFSGKGWLLAKHMRFIRSLFDGKYAVDIFDPKSLEFQPASRLDPSAEIAEKIRNL